MNGNNVLLDVALESCTVGTEWALVRPFPSVSPYMALQVLSAGEPLLTEEAGVRCHFYSRRSCHQPPATASAQIRVTPITTAHTLEQ